jgi:hypothetical protein
VALRFESQYKTKRLDNLGDPEWHNRRWQDIDRRMHARELDAQKIDNAANDLEAAALARLNDQLTPIIAQAITRLRDFGLLFSATSHTERTIQTGNIQFVIDESVRESFVATGFLIIRPTGNLSIGMSARTLSYDNSTGVLTVDSYSTLGAGSFSDWSIGVTGDPDLSHATRTDNPHQTTAEQVGAYTTDETNDAIAAAIASEAAARNAFVTASINALINSAPGALDTLQELAASLANDPNFATTITNALANRVRFDQSQVLDTAQKQQVKANVAGAGANQLIGLDANSRLPRVDATVLDGVPKIPQGRLTVSSSGAPWGPQHGSLIVSALRYVPYVGCYIPIYDPSYGGLRMAKFTTSDSDALGYNLNMAGSSNFPANSIMDLFAAFHPTTGAVVIGAGLPWSAATVGGAARAPAGGLAKYQGVDVNASAIGLRADPTTLLTIQAGCATWLGTMQLWGANQLWWLSFKADDISTPGQVPLWNRYNQKRLNFGRSNPTGSWTVGQSLNYSGTNPNGGIIYWVDGAGGEPFEASYYQYVTPGASSSGFLAIGHNGVSAEAEYGYLWPGLTQNYEAQLRHKRSTLGLNFVGQLIQCITEVGTLAGGTPNNMIMLGVDL